MQGEVRKCAKTCKMQGTFGKVGCKDFSTPMSIHFHCFQAKLSIWSLITCVFSQSLRSSALIARLVSNSIARGKEPRPSAIIWTILSLPTSVFFKFPVIWDSSVVSLLLWLGSGSGLHRMFSSIWKFNHQISTMLICYLLRRLNCLITGNIRPHDDFILTRSALSCDVIFFTSIGTWTSAPAFCPSRSWFRSNL